MSRIAARSFITVIVSSTMFAACGGKSTPTETIGSTGGSGDGAGADSTPFDQAQVQETLAAMPVPDACGGPDAAATLAELLQAQREALGDESETEVSFDCRPNEDAPWDCMWSALTRPSGPDDEGGSGYQIIFRVDDTGAIDSDSVHCIAPG